MPIICDQNEATCLIRLEGEVNIFSAAELKRLLLEALGSGKELHVDLAGATDTDITALQLLWAAEREARQSSREFTLVGHVPEGVSGAPREAGLEKFPILVE